MQINAGGEKTMEIWAQLRATLEWWAKIIFKISIIVLYVVYQDTQHMTECISEQKTLFFCCIEGWQKHVA